MPEGTEAAREGPAAEAARAAVAEVADRKVQLRKTRSSVRWARDCGSAGVVGGATVALTLMLGGGAVTQDVFVAFNVIWGLILIASAIFAWRAAVTLGAQVSARVMAIELVPGVGVVVVAIRDGFGGRWPIEPHTGEWWELIALALVVSIASAIRRHRAESLMEQLADG